MTNVGSHIGPQKEVQLNKYDHATVGALSGAITRCIVQPLDVLKIRFQLQVEPIHRAKGGLYHGVSQAFGSIIQTEGIRALWKGHVAAQLLTVSYGIGQFGSYAWLSQWAMNIGAGDNVAVQGACGATAGAIATFCSLPFDVVRTRLVAQGSPKIYQGLTDAFCHMVSHEGPTCLWRGLIPTMVQTAPQTAVQFVIYTNALRLMHDTLHLEGPVGLGVSALCGTFSGIGSKVAVYPLEVLKKRIQIRGFEKARHQFGKVVVYKGMWDCLVRVTTEEGVLAWFKGLAPSLLKSAASTALIYGSYEQLCQLLVFVRKKKSIYEDA